MSYISEENGRISSHLVLNWGFGTALVSEGNVYRCLYLLQPEDKTSDFRALAFSPTKRKRLTLLLGSLTLTSCELAADSDTRLYNHAPPAGSDFRYTPRRLSRNSTNRSSSSMTSRSKGYIHRQLRTRQVCTASVAPQLVIRLTTTSRYFVAFFSTSPTWTRHTYL